MYAGDYEQEMKQVQREAKHFKDFNEDKREEYYEDDDSKESRPSSELLHPRCLILAPTRELACQIQCEAKKICFQSFLQPVVVYGGIDLRDQLVINS